MILDASAVKNGFFPTPTPATYNPPQMGQTTEDVEDVASDDLPADLSGRPAWVLPAAIGGIGLVAVGGYFLMRRGK